MIPEEFKLRPECAVKHSKLSCVVSKQITCYRLTVRCVFFNANSLNVLMVVQRRIKSPADFRIALGNQALRVSLVEAAINFGSPKSLDRDGGRAV